MQGVCVRRQPGVSQNALQCLLGKDRSWSKIANRRLNDPHPRVCLAEKEPSEDTSKTLLGSVSRENSPCLKAQNPVKEAAVCMKRLFAVCFSLAVAGAPKVFGDEQSTSPYATAADFARYAMKLREQALLKVEPQVLIPTSSRPAVQRYAWKMNIVTTVFWVGEQAGGNNPVPNYKSCWDFNWTANYGGTDNPEPSARRNYIPIAFVPRQNPFYFALPYNDVTHGQFKPEAPLVIPWFKQSYTGPGQSVCRHRWIAIRKGNRLCYAQWEDCGPFRTDHFQYVFGNERPKPNLNHGAGLDVSPAVRDYLGLAPTDVTDWQFVEVRDVPPGPWRSYGDNNHFVLARRQSEQRVAAGGSGAAKK